MPVAASGHQASAPPEGSAEDGCRVSRRSRAPHIARVSLSAGGGNTLRGLRHTRGDRPVGAELSAATHQVRLEDRVHNRRASEHGRHGRPIYHNIAPHDAHVGFRCDQTPGTNVRSRARSYRHRWRWLAIRAHTLCVMGRVGPVLAATRHTKGRSQWCTHRGVDERAAPASPGRVFRQCAWTVESCVVGATASESPMVTFQ